MIDEIVEQFYSSLQEGLPRTCAIYKETMFEEYEGYREDFDHCGAVIPKEQLEFDRDDDRLRDYSTHDRINALADGAEPTEDEKQEYRRRVIAEAEDGSADYDYIPGYYIYKLRHTDGRDVFALETVLGYSFSGVRNTFHGLFSSAEDALKNLSTWGLVVRS
jgi:hypothetical protein